MGKGVEVIVHVARIRTCRLTWSGCLCELPCLFQWLFGSIRGTLDNIRSQRDAGASLSAAPFGNADTSDTDGFHAACAVVVLQATAPASTQDELSVCVFPARVHFGLGNVPSVI